MEYISHIDCLDTLVHIAKALGADLESIGRLLSTCQELSSLRIIVLKGISTYGLAYGGYVWKLPGGIKHCFSDNEPVVERDNLGIHYTWYFLGKCKQRHNRIGMLTVNGNLCYFTWCRQGDQRPKQATYCLTYGCFIDRHDLTDQEKIEATQTITLLGLVA